MAEMALIVSMLLAGFNPQAASDPSVYAVKPWASPVVAASNGVLLKSRSASANRAAEDSARVWPDPSQSVMRRFVCEHRPAGLAHGNVPCDASSSR